MGPGCVPVIWLKLAWQFLGWRGAAALAGVLAAGALAVMLTISQARLAAAKAGLRQQQAECAGQINDLGVRLAAAQAQAERLHASAEALASQVRDTEAACARERQRRAQATAALANVQPVPLKQAEADHAVVDLASSGRAARVLNGVFAGLCANATGPGPAAAGPGLSEPGAAGPLAPGPHAAPGQREQPGNPHVQRH